MASAPGCAGLSFKARSAGLIGCQSSPWAGGIHAKKHATRIEVTQMTVCFRGIMAGPPLFWLIPRSRRDHTQAGQGFGCYKEKWRQRYAGKSGLSMARVVMSPQSENVRFVQSRNVRFHARREGAWN